MLEKLLHSARLLHLIGKLVKVLKGFRRASPFPFSGKNVLEGFRMLLK